MRSRVRTIEAAFVLGVGVLSGCASTLPSAPIDPLLLADPADVQLIVALAQEQDTRVESCQARMSCSQDHYLRGLIALFQSRERAVAAFQQVESVAPTSRVATLSTSWIALLQASEPGLNVLDVQNSGVPKITEDFVWAVLEREFNEANDSVRNLFSDRAKRVGELAERRPAASQDQMTVQALQRRLHERERTLAKRDQQIEVLSNQLDALKRIDQDIRDRRRPLRPSVIVAP